MGYMITFHYHPKKDRAFDMESKKSFSKHIGKEDEDTPLQDVAVMMKSQFARRDILVVDCEVFEYTKKKVKVREVKGGVQLKDQRFLFDEIGFEMSAAPAVPEASSVPQLLPHEIMARQSIAKAVGVVPEAVQQQHAPLPQRPIRVEVFDPEPRMMVKLNKSYRFTQGKRYPIYREFSVGNTPLSTVTNYVTKDDRDVEVTLSAEYFTAAGAGLIGGFEADSAKPQSSNGLLYQNNSHGNYPVAGSVDEIPAEMMAVPDLSSLRGKI